MKILALDIGDQWVGSALSDSIGLLAKPHKTVSTSVLEQFLEDTFKAEPIGTVVIGYPITMRATKSEQTEAIIKKKDELSEKFPTISWVLWDERLSSKRAQSLKKAITKEEKIKAHSYAAAFILESYLTFQNAQIIN